MGVGFLWAIILGVGILFFDETPRFNFRNGKVDEAKKTMVRIYGVSENHYSIHVELEEIKAKLELEKTDNGFWREGYLMFFGPRMAYRIALGMGLQVSLSLPTTVLNLGY